MAILLMLINGEGNLMSYHWLVCLFCCLQDMVTGIRMLHSDLVDLGPTQLLVTAFWSSELATHAQDRGEPPGDDADAYTQVLAGLKLAARHAAEPLLDSLLTWRREALALAAKPKPEVMILRKRVHISPLY